MMLWGGVDMFLSLLQFFATKFLFVSKIPKTYVTQKAPRSTLPLNLTVSGQSRKAYVERGALFIGSAASRAFGVPWVCKFLW